MQNWNAKSKQPVPQLTPAHDLPRLDLLHTFDAAARGLSFTLAAEALSLTQSAVSRQIQQLEASLGVLLFERRHRALALTDAGRVMQRVVTDCLERLRDATAQVRAAPAGRQLSLTTTPSFASLWLIPRLASFTASHPGVDVRISATMDRLDLDRSQVDVAVRFTPLAGQTAVPLFEESVVPLCAPALLMDKAAPLKQPADLVHHTLLAVDTTPSPAVPVDWAAWWGLMGLGSVPVKNTLRFSQYADAVAAAVAGHGVLIGRLPLLDDLLHRGQLVAPFGRSAASRRGYFVLSGRRATRNPDAQDFIRWLRNEAAAAASGS